MAGPQARVVITGIGLISPLGNSPASLWQGMSEGRSGVRPLRSLPAEALPIACTAEAWDFSGAIDDFGPLDKQTTRSVKKGLKVMCREIQMGVAAAQLALLDSGLSAERRDPERVGISYGSDYIMSAPEEFTLGVRACLDEDGAFQFARWAEQGLPKVDPLWLLKYLPNMPASHVAIYNDLRGPNNSITLREASSHLALGEAYSILQRGLADAMVVGATGSRVHALRSVHVLKQEEVAQADLPAEQLSRPFDRDRCGMVLGEGAAALILETYEHAHRRGATMLGELIGYGGSTVCAPSGEGDIQQALTNAIRQALSTAERAAGCSPSSIGHIQAHGLSTRHCDRAEAQAIHAAFGPQGTPVVASKSYFGNVGAAGGMLSMVGSLLAMKHNQLPRVLNYDHPDPECPVRAVTEPDVPPGDVALGLSVTPQGQASAIVVRRCA